MTTNRHFAVYAILSTLITIAACSSSNNSGSGSGESGNGSASEFTLNTADPGASLACLAVDFQSSDRPIPSFDSIEYPSFVDQFTSTTLREQIVLGQLQGLAPVPFLTPDAASKACNHEVYATNACATAQGVTTASLSGTTLAFEQEFTETQLVQSFVFSDENLSSTTSKLTAFDTGIVTDMTVKRSADGTETATLENTDGTIVVVTENPDCSGTLSVITGNNTEFETNLSVDWTSAKAATMTVNFTHCDSSFDTECVTGQLPTQ